MHAMDYIDEATTGILSPHVLPVEDLRKDVDTHQRGTTLNHALTSFIRGYTSFLWIPMHPHVDSR